MVISDIFILKTSKITPSIFQVRNRKQNHHDQQTKQEKNSDKSQTSSSSTSNTSTTTSNSMRSRSIFSLSSWYLPVTVTLIAIVSYFVYIGYLVSL